MTPKPKEAGTEQARRSHARLLTARDQAILRFVGTQGVASLGQLSRRFWPGALVSTAQDRLTQLVRSGYLQAERCYLHPAAELVYGLRREGLLLFSTSERSGLQVGLPSAGEMKQSVLATAVRIRIEEQLQAEGGRLIGWKGERELRADCGREVAKRVRASGNARTVTPTPSSVTSPPNGGIGGGRDRRDGGGGGTGSGSNGGSGDSGQRRAAQQKHLDIADARAIVQTADGAIQEIDIEIDGQYYGKMLQAKAASLCCSSRPVVWACSTSRVAIVTRAVQDYPNITVMEL